MSFKAKKIQRKKAHFAAVDTNKGHNNDANTHQFVDNRTQTIARKKNQDLIDNSPQSVQLRAIQENQQSVVQKKEDTSALPNNLKTGIEALSGVSMEDVKVHPNSAKPAQLQAHAYAQGSDIHLGPNQEKHLPHEAWHVVQQKQGRVKPTVQTKSNEQINDDPVLEQEADIMGAKANNFKPTAASGIQNKSLPTQNNIQLKSLVIQRAAENAIVVDGTSLKKNEPKDGTDTPMGGKVFGSSSVGPKWKTGQIVPNVDFSTAVNGYYKVDYDGGVAWLSMTSAIRQGDLNNSTVAYEEENGLDQVSDRIGDVSDLADLGSGGLENTWLKGVDGKGGIDSDLKKGSGEAEGGSLGKFGDLKDKDAGIETAKNATDFASGSLGTLSSLWGMKTAAQDFYKEPSWKAAAEGVESLVGGVANSAKAVDGMAKALGYEKGSVKDGDTENNIGSDIVAKYTGAISDGVSSVKNAFLGFVGLWKLYSSPSNTKGKDALVSTYQITKSALSAVKVAKSAYDIIGKGTPAGLITAIPGLSIAVSAINLIIRFADAWQAGGVKNSMEDKSEGLRPLLARSLGEAADDKSENIFRTERRGVFPAYKSYYRTYPNILSTVISAHSEGVNARDNQADESTSEGIQIKDAKSLFDAKVLALTSSTAAADSNKSETSRLLAEAWKVHESHGGNSSTEYKAIYEKWKAASDKQEELDKSAAEAGTEKSAAEAKVTSLPDEIVKSAVHDTIEASSTKPSVKAALKGKVTGKDSLDKLVTTSDDIKEYEVVDKMSEINQKRQVAGYSDVVKEMINISADIATLSGVGAIVGTAMKGAVAAESLAHAGAKGVQQIYRDQHDYTADEVDKSSSKKHEQYVNHTQHIFRMLSVAQTEDQAKNVLAIMKATGVNTGMMFAINGEPAKQAEMMISAMKKRN